MTETSTSYRRILKSSSIIGGASFANILIGLVRTKVLAILLGPTGVGLVSLYRGLLTTASTVATMGLDTVGTRQIAEANAKQDARALAVARHAMFWGTLALASVGTLVVWCFRKILAERVLGSAAHAGVVGWLAVGVALTVVAASQGALIQGMRRIADLARISVYGAVVNTVVGIALIWRWGHAGLVFYVLMTPIASFLVGYWYVSRLPKAGTYCIPFPEMAHQWKTLLRLGTAFMGAALVSSLIQLWIRVDIDSVLGTKALGQFQASWAISGQYIGFVLGAMGADYYPRLTGVIHDRNAAIRLVNEQTEIALLLSAPIFIAMMGLTPWIIQLLYSSTFSPAVIVLRWQILSDVLKVAAWPLGFVILAAGDGKTFFWSETLALLIIGVLIAGLLRVVGLEITGIAYLVCYAFYLPLVYILAKSRLGFKWSFAVTRLLFITFVVCAGVGTLASVSRWGELLGCMLSALFGIYSLGQLSHMSNMSGSIGKIGAMARRITAKLGLQ
jgi:PST family polysaccharide transporter